MYELDFLEIGEQLEFYDMIERHRMSTGYWDAVKTRRKMKGIEYATLQGLYFMLESAYQAKLIKKLERMFPGCMVIKMDPHDQQGILDLLVLFGRSWGSLEVKVSASARHQPNQDYFVQHLDDMSFAAFIFPENEEEVLGALQQAFAA